MEPLPTLDGATLQAIDGLIDSYQKNISLVKTFQGQISAFIGDHEHLAPNVHSVRWRLKDPDHLRTKLVRKALAAQKENRAFDIAPANLLERVNDLVGFRILHLHTRQMAAIDQALRGILDEAQLPIIEGPWARSWDDESRNYFTSIGITVEPSNKNLYTSVHYIIASNSKTRLTAEIQVRTLAEELWGEVDHAINYPDECPNLGCREQLKVLARVSSSCTRLVDSIFTTYADATKDDGKPPS